jgi:hypothetical protein
VTSVRLLGSRDLLEALCADLSASAFAEEFTLSAPEVARRDVGRRSSFGQFEVWEVLVSIGVNVGSRAAYDYLKSRISARGPELVVAGDDVSPDPDDRTE